MSAQRETLIGEEPVTRNDLGNVSVRDVSKSYRGQSGVVEALRGVSFDVESGEIVSVLGPSGCGKSTVLKIVAGLLPFEGEVFVDGQKISGPHADVGVMFQSPVLFPWKTITKNVLLPTRIKGSVTDDDRARAKELLDLVGLEEFADSLPGALSGGMQQRAALCRTLLTDPRILLLDEPFGALDELTRERLNLEVLAIHQRLKKTMMMITHNITESVFMSDRVVVMTPRPGEIAGIVDIDLPRPRETTVMKSQRFAEHVFSIRRLLGLEKG